MTDNVDDFFAHYGVKGMKWGKRNAAEPSTGPKNPSYARVALLGAIGNGKSRFSDPKALKQRSAAGKLFAATIAANLASTALSSISAESNNPSVKAGAAVAGKLLGAAGAGTGLASLGLGISAVTTERAARNGSQS